MIGTREWWTHCRIEEPARHSEEEPRINGEGEAEAEADVEELGGVRALRKCSAHAATRRLRRVGDLGTRECKEPRDMVTRRSIISLRPPDSQEEKGSDELARHSNKVIARAIRQPREKFDWSRVYLVVRRRYRGASVCSSASEDARKKS